MQGNSAVPAVASPRAESAADPSDRTRTAPSSHVLDRVCSVGCARWNRMRIKSEKQAPLAHTSRAAGGQGANLSGARAGSGYGILGRPMNYRISKAALLGLLVAACGDSTVSGGLGPSDSPSVPGDGSGSGGPGLEPGPGDAAGSNPNT